MLHNECGNAGLALERQVIQERRLSVARQCTTFREDACVVVPIDHTHAHFSPATAHMPADEAYPKVGIGAAGAAPAGTCVAAVHAVAAHRARCVTPTLEALPMEAMVAHLQG